LEIYYDETRNKWYALILVDLGVDETRMVRRANS
jgi:hypothetical protein